MSSNRGRRVVVWSCVATVVVLMGAFLVAPPGSSTFWPSRISVATRSSRTHIIKTNEISNEESSWDNSNNINSNDDTPPTTTLRTTVPAPRNFTSPEAVSSFKHTSNRTKTTRTIPPVPSASPSLPHDTRLVFLWHIGPHKTATSAIQCRWTFLQQVLHDATPPYEYLGRTYDECAPQQQDAPHTHTPSFSVRALLSCLNRHDAHKRPCPERAEYKAFVKLLERTSRERRHVILSDEASARMTLSASHLRIVQSTLEHYNYRAVVVMVYRPYFDWIVSMYNEKYKPLPRRERFQMWPEEKHGKPIRTFPDYYRRVLQHQGIGGYQLDADKRNVHAVQYLRDEFGKVFDDVQVFHMHTSQEGSLVTNFVERFLPDASTNRQVSKKLHDSHAPQRLNPSLPLDYDLIAVAAHREGLLPHSKLKRHQVARVVAGLLARQSTNYTENLPRECLTFEEEAALLNRSFSFEEQLFPHDWTNMTQREHEVAFAAASKRRKFCNVDVEAILSMKDWVDFFRRVVDSYK